MRKNRTCQECGKPNSHWAMGLCQTCYQRLYQRKYYKKHHEKLKAYQNMKSKEKRRKKKNELQS